MLLLVQIVLLFIVKKFAVYCNITMSAMAMARVHPTSTSATKEKQVRFPPTHGGYYKDDSDYEDIEDSDSEASYHSEGDEIAEYWDPYCKLITSNNKTLLVHVFCFFPSVSITTTSA